MMKGRKLKKKKLKEGKTRKEKGYNLTSNNGLLQVIIPYKYVATTQEILSWLDKETEVKASLVKKIMIKPWFKEHGAWSCFNIHPQPPNTPAPHPFPIDQLLFLPDIFRKVFLRLSSLEQQQQQQCIYLNTNKFYNTLLLALKIALFLFCTMYGCAAPLKYYWTMSFVPFRKKVSQCSSPEKQCSPPLKSSQVKRTPQASINEFVIRKLNPLVVVDFKFISAFLHA